MSGTEGSGHGRLSRRALVLRSAAGAAAVASTTLPRPVSAAIRRSRRSVDVAIVGAGLAGLTTARELRRRGHSVIVMEARERVGGRTCNVHARGGRIGDIGGTWIGPTQDRMYALANEFGLETFDSYLDGDTVYYRNGRRTTFDGSIFPVPPLSAEVLTAVVRVDEMAKTIPVEEPWRAPRAREWDSKTLQTWIDSNLLTPDGRFIAEFACRAIWVCESKEISLLHALATAAKAGDKSTQGTFERLISTSDGAQKKHFTDGAQSVSIALAKRLGRSVVLRTPVRLIEQGRRGARVVSDRVTVSAKRVVVTVPPALQANLRFDPVLPGTRAQLLQRWPQGTEVKHVLFYEKPFWREDGLQGTVFSDEGPVIFTADGSPKDGSYGVLLAWVKSHEARAFVKQSLSKQREGVLESLARYFGPKALHPTAFRRRDWSQEPWTRGCFGAYGATGMWTEYGREVRAPFGRVHWAGTETSDYWIGYMDGAVRSGERVAREVMEAL